MNEDWKENMAYAPLIVAEVDTDYQKVEDFTERDRKTAEKERTLVYGIEDYFGGNEVSEELVLLEDDEEDDEIEVEIAEDDEYEDEDEDMMAGGEVYDDYETMPEIPTDIYSGEEY